MGNLYYLNHVRSSACSANANGSGNDCGCTYSFECSGAFVFMILTGIIQLLELVVPAFWLMVLLALRTAMATVVLTYVPAFADTVMLVDSTILSWAQGAVSTCPLPLVLAINPRIIVLWVLAEMVRGLYSKLLRIACRNSTSVLKKIGARKNHWSVYGAVQAKA